MLFVRLAVFLLLVSLVPISHGCVQEIGSFDLPALVKKTAEPFAALAGAKGVKFGISAPGELFIESDARRIRQVLVNIISNAVKFTDSGAISVDMAEEDGGVRITIADTGIGISTGYIEKPINTETILREIEKFLLKPMAAVRG